MELSTPIDRLPVELHTKEPINPDSVMNYADILKGVDSDMTQLHNAQQKPPQIPQGEQKPQHIPQMPQMPQQGQHIPQMPQVPQQGQHIPQMPQVPQQGQHIPQMPHVPQQGQHIPHMHMPMPRRHPMIEKRGEERASHLKSDFVILVVASVVLHSAGTQSLLQRFIPHMLTEGRISVLGTLINGLLIASIFVLSRNVSIGLKM